MFSGYRLLLLDIDGTIARENFLVTTPVKKSVAKISKSMNVALVSNRSQNSVVRYSKILNLGRNNIHACEGGAKIIRGDGSVIFVSLIARRPLEEIVEYLLKHHLIFNLCIDGNTRIVESGEAMPVSGIDRVTRLSVLSLGSNRIVRHIKFFQKIKEVNVVKARNVVDRNRWNIDITGKGAAKDKAAKKLMMILRVRKRQVAAVGDGLNDKPFILEAGFKVAMGNAPLELKKAVDYIAPSVYEDGFIQVAERILDAGKV